MTSIILCAVRPTRCCTFALKSSCFRKWLLFLRIWWEIGYFTIWVPLDYSVYCYYLCNNWVLHLLTTSNILRKYFSLGWLYLWYYTNWEHLEYRLLDIRINYTQKLFNAFYYICKIQKDLKSNIRGYTRRQIRDLLILRRNKTRIAAYVLADNVLFLFWQPLRTRNGAANIAWQCTC